MGNMASEQCTEWQKTKSDNDVRKGFCSKAATGPPVIAGGCWLTPIEVLLAREG